MTSSELKKGTKVTYTKTLAFGKGDIEITATVVYNDGRKVMLDNGDTFHVVNK